MNSSQLVVVFGSPLIALGFVLAVYAVHRSLPKPSRAVARKPKSDHAGPALLGQ